MLQHVESVCSRLGDGRGGTVVGVQDRGCSLDRSLDGVGGGFCWFRALHNGGNLIGSCYSWQVEGRTRSARSDGIRVQMADIAGIPTWYPLAQEVFGGGEPRKEVVSSLLSSLSFGGGDLIAALGTRRRDSGFPGYNGYRNNDRVFQLIEPRLWACDFSTQARRRVIGRATSLCA